jgi:hypothetical protein
MYRWRINLLRIFPALLFIIAGLSCSLIDLRPVSYSIEPDQSDTVLPSEYSQVSIAFDTEMDRQATEGIIKISSDTGMADGDVTWTGNTLIFTPVTPWSAGIRYSLNVSGVARAADGRELRLEKYLYFYAIHKSSAPQVVWFSPEDGASVEPVINPEYCAGRTSEIVPLLQVSPPIKQAIVELQFSLPMDRFSTETGFSIEGISDKQFHWSDDDTYVAVIPLKNPAPWTNCRWSLRNSAHSADGVPLAKTVSARFVTDADTLLPCVNRVYPALFSNGRWLATGGSPESHLGPGQGIVIEFNKPMADSVFNSIRFDPSLAGRTERISDKTVIFIPNRDPLPEIFYTLIISADAKDAGGLKMGEEFRMNFTADIPYLRILSVNADGAPVLDVSAVDTAKTGGDLNYGDAWPVPIEIPGGNVLRFTIRFSLPFDLKARQEMPRRISVSPIFPGTLAPIALRFVSWVSHDRLRMEWEGLQPGTDSQPHFYRLLVPGGMGGIDAGSGSYLRENQYLIVEAR